MKHLDFEEDLVKHKLDALAVFNSAFDEFGAALEKFNQSLSRSCFMMKMMEAEAKEFQALKIEERNRPF